MVRLYWMDFTALYFMVLYCTSEHCTTLHCTVLHCTVLYYTALHCTALHWTALRFYMRYTALHCKEKLLQYSLHFCKCHTYCVTTCANNLRKYMQLSSIKCEACMEILSESDLHLFFLLLIICKINPSKSGFYGDKYFSGRPQITPMDTMSSGKNLELSLLILERHLFQPQWSV